MSYPSLQVFQGLAAQAKESKFPEFNTKVLRHAWSLTKASAANNHYLSLTDKFYVYVLMDPRQSQTFGNLS